MEKLKIFSSIKELREQVKTWRQSGLSVGFVPTMGYLHEGHGSLIKKAHEENDKVVVSIFVNPTQFGPNEDLDSYPRDLERDKEVCIENGASAVFTPSVEEMYGKSPCTFVDINDLSSELCGASRPGHFRGVCTVVSKLFNIVLPDRAYFGEKDAQQLAIIKKMVNDLNMIVEVVGCPIVREEDGLAKSSRNTYLSAEQRAQAVILSKSLKLAKEKLNEGERDSTKIKSLISNNINSMSLAEIDYVEIVDLDSLQKTDKIDSSILIALAVRFGKTRLIDNTTFDPNN